MTYDGCCGKYHSGALPENALQLMRSRYCAYALGKVEYLIDTTHKKSSTRSPNTGKWSAELLEFCKTTSFDGLEILDFADGKKTATVTFTARLTQAGRDGSFTEKSDFVKENGRWFYKDGKFVKGK